MPRSGLVPDRNGRGAEAGRTGVHLPTDIRTGLEQLSTFDLSGVRVHRRSSRPARVGALATTRGADIHLGPGGDRVLAHEGWHVVQQMQGRVRPTVRLAGVAINDDPVLEREAEVMARRARRRRPADSAHPAPDRRLPPPATGGVTQRAMKFEYQIDANRLFRDNGTRVRRLPRKYGPKDYIVKAASGVRLESETKSQVEFETGWSRTWTRLEAQINEARAMTDDMNAVAPTIASDGRSYRELPFGPRMGHLGPGQGFQTTRGGVWTKEQKARTSEVTASKLNVRRGPGPDFEVVGELAASDRVEVLGRQRAWSRIEAGELSGWVASRFLRRPRKYYESNVIKKGMSPDSVLKPRDRILVDVRDRQWRAYIQPSESFALEQFGSYLRQFRKFSGGHRRVKDIHDDVVADVARIMAGGAEGPSWPPKAENLLMMVVYYIKLGRDKDNSVRREPAKFAFPLMSRTNFGSIFGSLTEQEQRLFRRAVNDRTNGILPLLGLNRATPFFVEGHAATTEPTVHQWLRGITAGEDLLSGKGISASMGRFRVEKETGRQRGLVRFERRIVPSPLVPASAWTAHGRALFETAMTERDRPSGEGQTGLRLNEPE